MATKPGDRPTCANFGSGPCTKRPGWTFEAVKDAPLGRSHRSNIGKAKLKACCDETKAILGLPDDYLVGVVPASDTGAVEMVMWSMLGSRPVDICYWETFGQTWYDDAVNQLKLDGVREFSAPFGAHPRQRRRPAAAPPPRVGGVC
jgi:phosphoserine aminotransferase